MPRDPRPSRTETLIPTTAMVGSAVSYQGQVERIYRPLQEWQKECYRHYGICGEARFAARFFGHALSRTVLYVAKRGANGQVTKQTRGVAVGYLEELFNGSSGQSEMLELIGVHLTVAGECFLVGRKVKGVGTWEVVSPLEMKVGQSGKKWSVDYGDGKAPVELTDADVVIRIWLPDPAKRIEADSPFKSMLPVLDEVEWATRHIFSQLSSRLAGAGLLALPNEATFPPPPPREGEDPAARTTTTELTSIMRTLADAMITPLNDPSNPASKVPIVVKMPGEHIDKVKLLHFWSQVDEKAMEVRRDALSRFADGMDMPREQVSGMSSNPGTGGGTSNGVSHWGAWQIEESTIKMFVEPMLDVVVNALTIHYIRRLVDDGTLVILGDTSGLRLRPDRSKEATVLGASGLISDEAVRRENGFSEDDKPDDAQFTLWLLRKVATGSATPEQVQAALTLLGVPLPTAGPPAGAAPREARPAPSLDPLPNRDRTPLENAALLPVAEALVLRALERVGSRMRQDRLRQDGVKISGVSPFAVHTVHSVNGSADKYLADAWSTAPIVLDGVGDAPQIVETLDSYCRSLLASQTPHTRQRLARFLEDGCSA